MIQMQYTILGKVILTGELASLERLINDYGPFAIELAEKKDSLFR